MSIEDVLDWIDRRELKGTLRLVRGKIERKLEIAYGCVTGAASDDPAEFLGQLLINAGALDEDGLRHAYASRATATGVTAAPPPIEGPAGAATSPVPAAAASPSAVSSPPPARRRAESNADGRPVRKSLGRTLLDLGVVEEAALREVLEVKVRECVLDALSWTDGAFEWIPTPANAPPRAAEVELAMPLRDLMMSGRERVAEWRRLHEVIKSDDQRFWLPDKSVLEGLDPASDEARILACVAAEMSVREIVLERHAMRFPIWKQLGDLLERGAIRLDRRRVPRGPGGTVSGDPESVIAAALGRKAGGDRQGALALAKQALDAAPSDERIRKAYLDIERALFAELSRTLLSRYRVPRLAKPAQELANLELSAEERYFVGRIDGRWDLLSLMRVSPLREAEALITLQKLAARGVITLD